MSTTIDYLSAPLRTFLADTAAKSPTPGGGSVAALVGALSASLARMAVEYTMGKEKFAQHEGRLRELLDELKRAGDMFEQLLSEDMTAYERFAVARKSRDPEQIQRALSVAIGVPMEIVVLAGAVAARLDEIKSIINPYLLSDLQVAAILAYSSARSACTSVRVNINDLADRAEAKRLENQLDMLVGRTGRHRNAVVHYQPSPPAGTEG